MDAIHTIRLRGAWVISQHQGRTQHSRNFGRPRALDPGERVWLVCAHVPGAADVLLNGQQLGHIDAPAPFAADITDMLAVRNTVAFVVESGEPLGEVTLEMRQQSRATDEHG